MKLFHNIFYTLLIFTVCLTSAQNIFAIEDNKNAIATVDQSIQMTMTKNGIAFVKALNDGWLAEKKLVLDAQLNEIDNDVVNLIDSDNIQSKKLSQLLGKKRKVLDTYSKELVSCHTSSVG